MTTDAPTVPRLWARRFRWIYLAPVLAFIALSAWAFASPVGAGPDDDYHLISIWCAQGERAECLPGSEPGSRSVSAEFGGIVCYAMKAEVSAGCQSETWEMTGHYETGRGNFVGEYPPVYYVAMSVFAGHDVQVSALAMRLVNAALFVGLATALMVLLPVVRRRTLLWGWLITVMPLGLFLIPSNNPSGWALTGVGTAFLALLGWFETGGRRRWALGALYLVGVVMAAGARADAGVYAIGATVTATILTSARTRGWSVRAALPLIGIGIGILFLTNAAQASVGLSGFTSEGAVAGPGAGEGGVGTPAAGSLSGLALAAYNLLMLPYLWTGVWGTWALGWFDTGMPPIVSWAAVAAFIVVAFAGLGHLNWRKAISVAGVLLVLIALPVYVLTVGGLMVGDALQPRYLLPLIVLLSLVLVTMPSGRELFFTRVQLFTILGALAVANLVALQVNIRRYVTGVDQQGPNLDAGVEWWWSSIPVGPTGVWLVGVLAFAGLLAVLWPQLRQTNDPASVAAGRG